MNRDAGERVRSRHTRTVALLLEFALLAATAAAAPPPQGVPAPRHAALGDLFRPPVGKPHRVSSSSNDPSGNLDFVPLASGAEITLADLKGPGVITRLWITVESDDPYYGRLLVLRARWDGERVPSIEVPIGDFFGAGHSLEADVDTLPVRVAGDGRGRTSYWPMPFNESAEISLRSDSGRPARLVFWQIDWTELPHKQPDLRTFHALFRASEREPTLRQHRVAEILGRGHYVGTVLSIWSGEEGWPGEGDDRFFLDGEQVPSLVGIGLEGYFDDAWGFRAGTGPFGGVTVWEGSGAGARTTAVRWHVLDPVPFEKGLAVAFERAGYAERDGVMKLARDRNDAFSSVAFWYQEEPHGPMAILPPQHERLPFFEVRVEPEEQELFDSIEVAEGAPPPERRSGAFWAYGGQVAFAPRRREEGRLSFAFDVPRPRDYDLYVRLTRGPDAGAWQVSIDDEPIGAPMDLHAPRALLREQLLGRRRLLPGGHVVELRCTGRNLESTGFGLGLDSFMARWYP